MSVPVINNSSTNMTSTKIHVNGLEVLTMTPATAVLRLLNPGQGQAEECARKPGRSQKYMNDTRGVCDITPDSTPEK